MNRQLTMLIVDDMEVERISFAEIFKDEYQILEAENGKQAMEQLELAYMAARSDSSINQLLLIPCVILDFLCIHPFRDGNGTDGIYRRGEAAGGARGP